MQFDLYHDESKIGGYWHGYLLVPHESKNRLFDILESSRSNIKYTHQIKFEGINKSVGRDISIKYSWLTIAVSALAQKFNSTPLGYFNGLLFDNSRLHHQSEYILLSELIKAKFIIFRFSDSHKIFDDTYFPDYASKIETTLRIGLKGGLNFFAASNDLIHLRSIHLDGHQHYGRHIDVDRIVGRIDNLHANCSFSSNLIVNDHASHEHDYVDYQFLQLTDLLIGAFRAVILGDMNSHQRRLTKPIQELIGRWAAGPVRMRNSRWHKGFCFSSASLNNGSWEYTVPIIKPIDDSQTSLF